MTIRKVTVPAGPTPIENRLTIGRLEKIIGCVIAIMTVFGSVGGTYMVNNYRLNEYEKVTDKLGVRMDQQDAYGHPDHERRITKLETRVDIQDNSINEINRKLDVVVTILSRLDKSMTDAATDRVK